MAVNVAMPQLRQPGFPATVRGLLDCHSLDANRIEIEITESVALEDPQEVRASLALLRESGIRVAIDDFGTGYSSLAQVRGMPIDVIKLDRSFVQALDQPGGEAFAETIVRMAGQLGLQTIAEGVETEYQRDRLAGLGCDVGQGWLFARPMPLDALQSWLAARWSGAR
jgi:EAL domain-containing protein (putative c-di-GMP-specific phosphodiesterase class I)